MSLRNLATLISVLLGGLSAHALDSSNPVVVSGSASFQQNGSNWNITTNSNKTIINWQNFGVPYGSTTKFNQPGVNSATLNRVTGSMPSRIDGSLLSNGRVYLINQHGVIIGATGVIQTGGFVASTLDVQDSAFLNGGELHFTGSSTAAVINLGQIEAAGDVYLIASQVTNAGSIRAARGTVGLVAAKDVLLTNDNQIFIQPVQGDKIDGTGVANTGQIQAVRAELLAQGNLYSMAINNSGTVNALGVHNEDGRVILRADGGTVLSTGTITAKTELENGLTKGGEVQVLGETVILDGKAKIDVSGETGGGAVNIGGNNHGEGSLPNAKDTYVGSEVSINADATKNGNGGSVIVWSNEFTIFNGQISARGGTDGGNGGYVETSGDRLSVGSTAVVNLLAPKGKVGTWLLDPVDIVVQTGGAATLAQVDQFADNAATEPATIDPSLISGSAADVTLQAKNSVTFANNITNNTSNTDLTVQAGGNIIINAGVTLSLTSGKFTFTANDNTAGTATGTGSIQFGAGSTLITKNDTITLTVSGGTGGITGSGNLNTSTVGAAAGGNITVTAPGAVSFGSITTDGGINGGTGQNAGSISITGGTVTVGTISAMGHDGSGTNKAGGAGGSVSLNATGGTPTITLNGSITTTGGDATGNAAAGNGGTISIQDPAVLGANATLSAKGGTPVTGTAGTDASITFGGTITGPHNLTIDTGAGLLSGITGIDLSGTATSVAGGNLSITTSNATALNLGVINTSGGTGNAIAGGDVVISAAGADLTLTTITTSGGNGSADEAGGAAGLVNLTASRIFSGLITAKGGNGAGASDQNGGAGGSVSLNATSGTPLITLTGGILTTGGDSFGAGANGTGGSIHLFDPASISGALSFNSRGGTNGGASEGAGGTINFDSTIDGAGSLSASSGSGNITFSGAVGGTTRVGGISVSTTGTVTITGNFRTANADITISNASAITLGSNSTLDSASGGTAGNGGNIDLGSAAIGGAFNLTIDASPGTSGTYGDVTAGNITLSGTGVLTVVGKTVQLGNLNTTGTTVGGAIALDAVTSLTTGTITSNGTTGVGGNLNINQTAATDGSVQTGAISLTGTGGAGGVITASGTAITLGSINTSSNTGGAGGNVTVTGTGVVSLSGITTNAANNSAANGFAAGAVNISGSTVAVGAISALGGDAGGAVKPGGAGGSVTLNATGGTPTVTLGGNITTTGGDKSTTGAAGAGGAVSVQDPALLSGNVTISTLAGAGTSPTDGTITFASTVTGPHNFTLTSGTGAINISGGINLSGGTDQAGGNLSITTTNGSTLNIGNVATNGGAGSAGKDGQNAGSVNISAVIISIAAINAIGGNGGATDQNGGDGGAITLHGTSGATPIVLNGNVLATGGNGTGTGNGGNGGTITFQDATILNPASMTISSAGGTGASNGTGGDFNATTINGASALTISAGTGAVTVTGAIGGTAPLSALTISDAALVNLAANISTANGNVDMSGVTAITLTGNVIIDSASTAAAAGAINLGSVPVTGAFSLTLDASSAGGNGAVSAGDIDLSGAAAMLTVKGSTVTLGNLNTNGAANGGTISVTGSGLVNTGTISANGGTGTGGTVGLTGVGVTAGNLSATGGVGAGGNVTITGGAGNVSIANVTTSGGTAGAGGTVGITGAGITAGAGTAITTTGSSTGVGGAGGAVTITGTGTVILSKIVSSGGNGTVGGKAAGSVSVTGDLVTVGNGTDAVIAKGGNGAAGAGGAGGVVTLNATNGTPTITLSGNIKTNGGNGTTTAGAGGNVQVQDPALLGTAVIIDTRAGTGSTPTSGTITFLSGITGPHDLTLQSGNGAISVAGTIDTSGTATGVAGGNVTISTTSTLSLTAITTSGGDGTGVDGFKAGDVNLTASQLSVGTITTKGGNALGATDDNGGAGGTVTLTGAGSSPQITLNGDILSSGGSGFGAGTAGSGGTQTYNGDVLLGTNVTLTTTNSAVTFTGLVDGAHDLTIVGGAGTVDFISAVGSSAPLTKLDVQSTGTISVSANINTNGLQQYAGAVVLTADANFTTNNGGLTFLSTLDSDSTPRVLTIDTGTGALSFGGNVGTGGIFDSISISRTGGGVTLPFDLRANNGIDLNTDGANQTGGVIQASLLTLNGTGTFSLGTQSNLVNAIQGSITGDLTYKSGIDYSIGASGLTTVTTGNITLYTVPTKTLTLDNTVTAAGSFTESGGGKVTLATTLTVGTGTSINIADPLKVQGSSTLSTGATGTVTLGTVDAGGASVDLTITTGTLSYTGAIGSGTKFQNLTFNLGAALTLTNTISVTDTLILNVDGGITQNAGAIIDAPNLLLQSNGGSGNVVLTDNNKVGTLAADMTGNLTFTNSQTLTIDTVSAVNGINTHGGGILISAAGATSDLHINQAVASGGQTIAFNAGRVLDSNATITSSGASIGLTSGTSMDLGADVNAGAALIGLSAGGAVTQSGGVLNAGSLAMQSSSGAADWTLNGANTVGIIAANIGGALSYTSAGALQVDTVNSVVGITAGTDVTLSTGGLLNLTKAVTANAATGTVNLTSTGGVTQNATGIVTGQTLVLNGSGAFNLSGATNQVAQVEGSVSGAIQLTNGQSLAVDSNGLSATNQAITLTTTGVGSTIAIQGALDAGSGTIVLNTASSISETGSGAVTAGSLLLTGTGNATLNLNANDVGTLASNLTGAVDYKDANGLAIGTVNAVDGINGGTTVKVVTSTGALNVNKTVSTTGNNNITLTGATGLALGADVNAGTGAIFLTTATSGSITQSSGVITGGTLTVSSVGAVSLGGSTNMVDVLKGSAGTSIDFKDGTLLQIGSTGTGLSTTNGAITLTTVNAGSTLSIQEALTAGGSQNVTLNLVAGGSQSGTGIITGGKLFLNGTGPDTLNATNLVNTIGGNVAGNVAFKNGQDLNIDAGGLKTTGSGDITLTVTPGSKLTINNAINSAHDFLENGGGTVDLQSTVTVAAGRTLTISDNLTVTGTNTLTTGATGQVNLFGTVSAFSPTDDLTITTGTLNFTGVFSGFNDLTLNLNPGSALTIANSISVSGTLTLNVNGGVTQNPGKTLSALNLVLGSNGGSGDVTLNDAGNNVGNLAADMTGNLTFKNGGALNIAALSVSGIQTHGGAISVTTASGDLNVNTAVASAGGSITLNAAGKLTNAAAGTITSSNNAINLTSGGNMTLAGNVAAGTNTLTLTSSGVVNQTGGALTGNLLTLQRTGGSTNAWTLAQANNNFASLTADVGGALTYNDLNGLSVTGITSHGANVLLSTGAQLKLLADINAGAGSVLLDPGAGGVDGTAGGVIAGLLALEGTGNFTLTAGNTVGALETSDLSTSKTVTGDITLTNSGSLAIGANAINATGKVTLTLNGGTLTIGNTINANSGFQESGTASSVVLNNSITVTSGNISIANPLFVQGTQALNAGGSNVNVNTVDAAVGGGSLTVTANAFTYSGIIGNTRPLTDLTLNLGTALSVGNTLSVNGTLALNVTGGVTETATGVISANTLALNGTGTVDLTAGTNLVSNIEGSQNGAISLTNGASLAVDSNGLSTTAGQSITLKATGAGNGLTLSGVVSVGAGTLTLDSASGIAINGAVNAALGNVVLNFNGAVTQSASINTTNLSFTGAGAVTLLDANNTVFRIASAATGNFAYNDKDSLIIGTIGALNGINSGGGTITVSAGAILSVNQAEVSGNKDISFTGGTGLSLGVNGSVNAGTANVLLKTAVSGAITDAGTTTGVITANILTVDSQGAVTLDALNNSVNFFRGSSAGQIDFKNGKSLTVGQGGVGLSTTGNQDINLTATTAASTIGVAEALNAGNGTVRLNFSNGASDGGPGVIDAGALVLNGTGNVNLLGANQIGTLTGNVNGTVTVRNAQDLTVGAAGLVTVNKDIVLDTKFFGNFALDIQGSLSAGTANVSLVSGTGTSESGAGKITASTLILGGTGDVALNNPANQIDIVQGSVDGSISVTTTKALTVNNLNTASNNQDITLTAIGAASSMNINGTLAVNSGGTVTLITGFGITQTGTGAILADTLDVNGNGNVTLSNPANNVNLLTAGVATASSLTGNISYSTPGSLGLGSLSVTGNVTIKHDGTLSISGASIIGGSFTESGTVTANTPGGTVTASAGITVGPGKDITLNNNLVLAAGTTSLSTSGNGSIQLGSVTASADAVASLSLTVQTGNINFTGDLGTPLNRLLDISIKTDNAISVGRNFYAAGTATFDAGGAITQTSNLIQAGSVVMKAGGDITLAGNGVIQTDSLALTTTAGDIFQDISSTHKIIGLTVNPAVSATSSGFVDLIGLNNQIGSITGTSNSYFEVFNSSDMAVGAAGIKANNTGIALVGIGATKLTINGDLDGGGNQVILEFNNGITQTSGTIITAGSVTLFGSGTYDLSSSANLITAITSASITGKLSVQNNQALNLNNISTGGFDADFTTSAGNSLTLSGSINLSGGNLTLTSGQDISQPGGFISTNLLKLSAAGNAIINQGSNSVQAVEGGATGNLTLIESGDSSGLSITSNGLSAGGTLQLDNSGSGHALTLNGATSGNDIILKSFGSITQGASGDLTTGVAGTLNLAGSGGVTLLNAGNQIHGVETAGTYSGNVSIKTSTDLTVTSAGLTVSGQVKLDSDGAIHVSNGITTSGAGNQLTLVAQTGADQAAVIKTSLLTLDGAGFFNLGNAGNQIASLQTSVAGVNGDITVATSVAMDIGTNGITTTGVGVGDLVLTHSANLNVDNPIVLSGSFTENGGGTVTLGSTISVGTNFDLTFTTPVSLTGATALAVSGAGNLTLAGVSGLGQKLTLNVDTGTLTLNGDLGSSASKLGDVTIKSNVAQNLNSGAAIYTSGTLTLDTSAGGITDTGVISANLVTLNGTGNFTLSNAANAIANLNTGLSNVAGSINVTDGSNLSLTGITTTTGGSLTLNMGAGSILTITTPVNVDGDFTETGASATVKLSGTPINLTGVNGSINIGSAISLQGGTTLAVTGTGNLTLNSVSGAGQTLLLSVDTGALTLNGDLGSSGSKLGDVTINSNVAQNLNNTTGIYTSGTLALNTSAGGISDNGIVSANLVSLNGTGNFTLSNAGNTIANLKTGVLDVAGSINVTDGSNLSLTGVTTTTGGSLTLNMGAGSTLSIIGTQANVDGNFTETGASATVKLSGTPINLTGANGSISIGSAAILQGATTLTVTGTGNLILAGVSGGGQALNLNIATGALTQNGDLGSLGTNLGAVAINSNIAQNLNSGFGIYASTLTLNTAAGGISDNGVISAGLVTLNGTGNFTLSNGGNLISSLTTTGVSGITGNIDVTTSVTMSTGGTGIQASGNITLTHPGVDLTVTKPISAGGFFTEGGAGGTVTLSNTIIVGTNLTLNSAATLTGATSLTVSGAGNLTLSSVAGAGKDLSLNLGTGTLTLNGDLGTSGAALGNVAINSGGGQNLSIAAIYANTLTLNTAAGGITDTGLVSTGLLTLNGTGNFTLSNASNAISSLNTGVSNVAGAINITDGSNLNIGAGGVTTTGVGGDLTINMVGATALTIGNTLNLSGNFTETGATATVKLNGNAISLTSAIGSINIGSGISLLGASTLTSGVNGSIAIGAVSGTGLDLTLVAGTGGLTAGQIGASGSALGNVNLTVNKAFTLTSDIFAAGVGLTLSAGMTETTGKLTATAVTLNGTGAGDFLLTQSNQISGLSGTLKGNLTLTNTGTILTLGALSDTSGSAHTFSFNTAGLKGGLVTVDNLAISGTGTGAGTLTTAVKNLTASVGATDLTISNTGNLALSAGGITSGNLSLTTAGTLNINQIVNATGTATLNATGANTLTIGSTVTASSNVSLLGGGNLQINNVVTSTNGGISTNVAGTLGVASNLNATNGTVNLKWGGANFSQSGSTISALNLVLGGSLNAGLNLVTQVTNLGGTLTGGQNVTLNNTGDYTLKDTSVAIGGLNNAGGNIALAGASNVTGLLTADGLAITGTGGYTLGTNVNKLAGTITKDSTIANAGALNIDTVMGDVGLTFTGNTLQLTATGAVNLNQALNATGHQVNLTSAGATQASGMALSASGLTLSGTGTFMLNDAANAILALNGNVSGDTSVQTSTALTVSTFSTSGGALTLQTGDQLTLTGLISAGSGMIKLMPGANGVNQTGGILVAGTLVIDGTGKVMLTDNNLVNQFSANVRGTTTDSLTFNNAFNLTIGNFGSVNGIITQGGAVTINTAPNGVLFITAPINTGGGQGTATITGDVRFSGPPGTFLFGAAPVSLTAKAIPGGGTVIIQTNPSVPPDTKGPGGGLGNLGQGLGGGLNNIGLGTDFNIGLDVFELRDLKIEQLSELLQTLGDLLTDAGGDETLRNTLEEVKTSAKAIGEANTALRLAQDVIGDLPTDAQAVPLLQKLVADVQDAGSGVKDANVALAAKVKALKVADRRDRLAEDALVGAILGLGNANDMLTAAAVRLEAAATVAQKNPAASTQEVVVAANKAGESALSAASNNRLKRDRIGEDARLAALADAKPGEKPAEKKDGETPVEPGKEPGKQPAPGTENKKPAGEAAPLLTPKGNAAPKP